MKILIVDDHAVVRAGVKRLLSRIPNVEIVETSTLEEGLEAFRVSKPDVVVLDIELKGENGLDMLRTLKAGNETARVVVFTMHSEPSYAVRAVRAGADGFVCKSTPADELITAVKQVASGIRHFDRTIANQVAINAAIADDPLDRLSRREAEIMQLLGEGKSLMQIAESFGVAYKTVANTCLRLKDKLGVARTADLIRIAIEKKR